MEGVCVLLDDFAILVDWEGLLLDIGLHEGVMVVGEDSDGVSLKVTNVLEEKLAVLLPEGFIVVLEQSVLDHFLLILLNQKLLDLIGVSHP